MNWEFELKIKKVAVLAVALSSSLVLTACGGGGGGGGVAAINGAEGVYAGVFEQNFEHRTIVLENGQYYILFGMTVTDGFAAMAFAQGSGQSNNGSFSSSDLKFFPNPSLPLLNLNVSYSTANFNGTISSANGSSPLTGTPIDAAVFNYKSAADLSAITGTWTLSTPQNESVVATITANGGYSASSGTCSITGTITPRPSGRNVFNVTQTFGAACPLAGQSTNGIAVSYPLTNGKRQLIVAVTSAARDYGATLFGAR